MLRLLIVFIGIYCGLDSFFLNEIFLGIKCWKESFSEVLFKYGSVVGCVMNELVFLEICGG